MTHEVPTSKAVKDLFEDLLERDVTVGTAVPVRAADLLRSVVAVYVDNALRMGAVVGLDLGLAAYAGAALGLIPAGGAKACLEDNELTPVLSENVTEICNVMASVLNAEGESPLRLYQTFMPGDQPPADAAGHLLALGRRTDLSLAVSGYGTGRLSIAMT